MKSDKEKIDEIKELFQKYDNDEIETHEQLLDLIKEILDENGSL